MRGELLLFLLIALSQFELKFKSKTNKNNLKFELSSHN